MSIREQMSLRSNSCSDVNIMALGNNRNFQIPMTISGAVLIIYIRNRPVNFVFAIQKWKSTNAYFGMSGGFYG